MKISEISDTEEIAKCVLKHIPGLMLAGYRILFIFLLMYRYAVSFESGIFDILM